MPKKHVEMGIGVTTREPYRRVKFPGNFQAGPIDVGGRAERSGAEMLRNRHKRLESQKADIGRRKEEAAEALRSDLEGNSSARTTAAGRADGRNLGRERFGGFATILGQEIATRAFMGALLTEKQGQRTNMAARTPPFVRRHSATAPFWSMLGTAQVQWASTLLIGGMQIKQSSLGALCSSDT